MKEFWGGIWGDQETIQFISISPVRFCYYWNGLHRG